jgi:hypothetical protein
MRLKKRLFTGIEIVLGICLLLGGASGVGNWKQKRALNQTAQENQEQANQISELNGKLVEANKTKDKITKDLLDTETALKGQARTGFSVLMEQALDIYKENATAFTEKHVETAKGYVHPDVWGYDASAQLFKWNMETIKKQQQETKRLQVDNDKLRSELEKAQTNYSKREKELEGKVHEHQLTATSLTEQVKSFTGENNLLFWVGIGLGVYFFISLGGFSLLGKWKRDAQVQLKETKRAIKTFTDVNNDGNDTMERIIKANKIDLDKD